MVAERVSLKSRDRLWPSELWHTQKDSGLAELDSVTIKKSAFEVKLRLVILGYFFSRVKFDISRLFCANAFGINMATRFEKRLKKAIYNMAVLQYWFETLRDRSICLLEVVDEQAEMLCMCRVMVRTCCPCSPHICRAPGGNGKGRFARSKSTSAFSSRFHSVSITEGLSSIRLIALISCSTTRRISRRPSDLMSM